MTYHTNIIQTEYNYRAVYKLKTLPSRGYLSKDGTKMKIGDTFTQDDIFNSKISYTHEKLEPQPKDDTTYVDDKFTFTVPISGNDVLKAGLPRKPCDPGGGIPADGVYTFNLRINLVPYPRLVRNNIVTLYEDESKCLSEDDLYATNKLNYVEPEPPEPPPPTDIFYDWKRFGDGTHFDNGNVATGEAIAWDYDPATKDIKSQLNSSSYIGFISPDEYENYEFYVDVSSDAADDDTISVVAAYTNVPSFLAFERSPGGNGGTWRLMQRTGKGSPATVLVDNSNAAPSNEKNGDLTLSEHTFTSSLDGWSSGTISKVSGISVVGPLGGSGAQTFSKKFTHPGSKRAQSFIKATIYAFNTVDYKTDYAYIYLNGQKVFEVSPDMSKPAAPYYKKLLSTISKIKVTSSSVSSTVVKLDIEFYAPFSGTTNDVTWGFGFKTDQALSDESFGIGAVTVGLTGGGGWKTSGVTRIWVKREGNTFTAKTSQFGSTTLDDSTTITYTLPGGSQFSGAKPFGIGAYSQQNALFQNATLNDGDIFTEPPPPPKNEIIYNVLQTSAFNRAQYTKDGVPLKVGDSFTQNDILDGKICLEGTLKDIDDPCNTKCVDLGDSNEYMKLQVCNDGYQCNVPKCITIQIIASIKSRPSPAVITNTMTIEECTTDNFIDCGHILTWSEGEHHSNMKICVDWDKTEELYSPLVVTMGSSTSNTNLMKLTPEETDSETKPVTSGVTYSTHDYVDAQLGGKIKVNHLCPLDPFKSTQKIAMKVYNKWGKCKDFVFNIKITKKKLPPPPPKDYIYDTKGGCSYKMNYKGQWEPSGSCGIWVTILNRDPYEIFDDIADGTVVNIPGHEPPLQWIKTPEGYAEVCRGSKCIFKEPDPDEEWPTGPRPPYDNGTAPEGDRYQAPDGTKFIADKNGIYRPVVGTFTGEPNLDPVILTGDYCINTADLSKVPATVDCIIYKDNYFERDSKGWVPSKNLDFIPEPPTLANITYEIPYFGFIGDNEFYFKYKEPADVLFWSMRYYTNLQIIDVKNGELLYGNYHRSKTYVPYVSSVGGPGPFKSEMRWGNITAFYPVNYTLARHNPTNPNAFVYYKGLPGIGNANAQTPTYLSYKNKWLFEFGAKEPIPEMPEVATYKIDKDSSQQVQMWERQTTARGLSLDNAIAYNGGGIRAYQNYLYQYKFYRSKETNPLDIHLHFLAWKKAFFPGSGTNPGGWLQARLRMMTKIEFGQNYNYIIDGKPVPGVATLYEQAPPTSNETFEFKVRATDLMTGRTMERTFKMHYNATGTSSNGRRSETTDDIGAGLPKGFLPPPQPIALCQFINNVAQKCKYSDPTEGPS